VVRWIDTGHDADTPPAIVGVGKKIEHEEDEDEH